MRVLSKLLSGGVSLVLLLSGGPVYSLTMYIKLVNCSIDPSKLRVRVGNKVENVKEDGSVVLNVKKNTEVQVTSEGYYPGPMTKAKDGYTLKFSCIPRAGGPTSFSSGKPSFNPPFKQRITPPHSHSYPRPSFSPPMPTPFAPPIPTPFAPPKPTPFTPPKPTPFFPTHPHQISPEELRALTAPSEERRAPTAPSEERRPHLFAPEEIHPYQFVPEEPLEEYK